MSFWPWYTRWFAGDLGPFHVGWGATAEAPIEYGVWIQQRLKAGYWSLEIWGAWQVHGRALRLRGPIAWRLEHGRYSSGWRWTIWPFAGFLKRP